MAESEMPDDIRMKAQAAIYGNDGRGMIGWDRHQLEDRVARALLSERERCAEIVRPFTMQGGTGGAFVRKAMWNVLDAIRQQ